MEDKELKTTTDVEDYIKICLAGVAAEELYFNQRTTGSSLDIENAKNSIRKLVRLYCVCGFDKIDISYSSTEWSTETDDYSECKKKKMERAENKLFKNLYKETKKMLSKNRKLLESIVDALLDKKVLGKEEIIGIYDSYRMRNLKSATM